MSRRAYDASSSCDATIVDPDAVARVLEAQPGSNQLSLVADIFAALSDPTRLRILLALSREDLCVCDLAVVTGVSSSAVSHQLRLLRDRRLVSFRREGKRAVYRLADSHVAALLAQGTEHAGERA
ncbi:MAG: metalloregulator ArsR/SmtB family transcription factor [Anaerosomatales bacterium]|nr:metalloregulator ArsR/SmtB family transcription factor [Anaerosomatales bacterium]MDT8434509.1 metalloregulator ArsR/SmtB family transcription factor [Anaerosomatales bacterium]